MQQTLLVAARRLAAQLAATTPGGEVSGYAAEPDLWAAADAERADQYAQLQQDIQRLARVAAELEQLEALLG